jgi:hypothetical protein
MLLKWAWFLSVFFRGFRGHNIHHYQIETVLGLRLSRQSRRSVSQPLITTTG